MLVQAVCIAAAPGPVQPDGAPLGGTRTPARKEIAGFLGNFDRRKVALGDCDRFYNPCIHEHTFKKYRVFHHNHRMTHHADL